MHMQGGGAGRGEHWQRLMRRHSSDTPHLFVHGAAASALVGELARPERVGLSGAACGSPPCPWQRAPPSHPAHACSILKRMQNIAQNLHVCTSLHCPNRMAMCPAGVNLLLANSEGSIRRFYVNRKGSAPIVNEMTGPWPGYYPPADLGQQPQHSRFTGGVAPRCCACLRHLAHPSTACVWLLLRLRYLLHPTIALAC